MGNIIKDVSKWRTLSNRNVQAAQQLSDPVEFAYRVIEVLKEDGLIEMVMLVYDERTANHSERMAFAVLKAMKLKEEKE